MNRKQFLWLMLAVVVMGGAGLALFWKDLTAYRDSGAKIGKPLLPAFAEVETDQWLPVLQVCLTSSDPANPMGKRQLTLLAKELQNRYADRIIKRSCT